MIKTIKRLISIMLLFSIICSGNVLASEENYKHITTGDLKVVSEKEVPAGVKPMSFKSDEEAIVYLNKMYDSMQVESNSATINLLARKTNGNVTVATQKTNYLTNAKILLKLRYTTSGISNTGRIEKLEPYTQFTGFTYGFEWKENNIGTTISSSGKDVHVYVDGTLSSYLLINGLIKLSTRDINLSGNVAVIR